MLIPTVMKQIHVHSTYIKRISKMQPFISYLLFINT